MTHIALVGYALTSNPSAKLQLELDESQDWHLLTGGATWASLVAWTNSKKPLPSPLKLRVGECWLRKYLSRSSTAAETLIDLSFAVPIGEASVVEVLAAEGTPAVCLLRTANSRLMACHLRPANSPIFYEFEGTCTAVGCTSSIVSPLLCVFSDASGDCMLYDLTPWGKFASLEGTASHLVAPTSRFRLDFPRSGVPWRPVVSRIAGGANHFLLLLSSGEVLSWGSGMHGQLGHGVMEVAHHNVDDDGGDARTLRVVESLLGMRATHVACGALFSVVVIDNGVLYTFGADSHGQLGRPLPLEASDCESPAKEEAPSSPRRNNADPVAVHHWDTGREETAISSVECGDRHVVVVSVDQRQVHSWGDSTFGATSGVELPEAGHLIREITAGGWWTAFLLQTTRRAS